jgi:transcriptional regulator with XRE-family HTH domain
MPAPIYPFALWFKGELRRRRMTQRLFATVSGVPPNTVGSWSRGKRRPSLTQIPAIAATLGYPDKTVLAVALAEPGHVTPQLERIERTAAFQDWQCERPENVGGPQALEETNPWRRLTAYLALAALWEEAAAEQCHTVCVSMDHLHALLRTVTDVSWQRYQDENRTPRSVAHSASTEQRKRERDGNLPTDRPGLARVDAADGGGPDP